MSLDLEVRTKHPLNASALFTKISSALSELLSIEATQLPQLVTTEFEQGGAQILVGKEFLDETCFWGITILGFHQVELMGIRLDEELKRLCGPDYPTTDEESGIRIEVAVRGLWHNHDPLKWALGAACAVALAREARSNIVDESLSWNDVYEQDAESFVRNVKAHKAELLHEAARTLREELEAGGVD